MSRFVYAIAPIILALTGCTTAPEQKAAPPSPQQSPFKPVVSVNQVMVSVIDHNSHIIWDVGPKSHAPKTDADWHALEHAAVTVAAAGSILMMGGTGEKDMAWAKDDAWKEHTQQMTDAGLQAVDAVQKKDLSALLTAGDNIVVACEACHNQFKLAIPKIRATPSEQPGH